MTKNLKQILFSVKFVSKIKEILIYTALNADYAILKSGLFNWGIAINFCFCKYLYSCSIFGGDSLNSISKESTLNWFLTNGQIS